MVELFNIEISAQKHCILTLSQNRQRSRHVALRHMTSHTSGVVLTLSYSCKQRVRCRATQQCDRRCFVKLRSSSIIKYLRLLCCVVIKTCHPPTQHTHQKSREAVIASCLDVFYPQSIRKVVIQYIRVRIEINV